MFHILFFYAYFKIVIHINSTLLLNNDVTENIYFAIISDITWQTQQQLTFLFLDL